MDGKGPDLDIFIHKFYSAFGKREQNKLFYLCIPNFAVGV